MAVLPIAAGSVSPVEIYEQWSAPSGGTTITAGQPVYQHNTTGWVYPCGTTNIPTGIAITSATYAGQAITAVRRGLIDLGGSALAGLNYGDPVYSGSAALDTAPTVGGTFKIGSVVPAFASHSGEVGGTLTTDRLLRVEL